MQSLNAELDVAFAMLNLASLTDSHEALSRQRKTARDIYDSANDLLNRIALQGGEQLQVRKRLEELRAWLEAVEENQAPENLSKCTQQE